MLHEGDTRRIQANHCSDIHQAAVDHQAAEETLWQAVEDARSQSVPWRLIGLSVGTSGSAAQQRFSKPPRGHLL